MKHELRKTDGAAAAIYRTAPSWDGRQTAAVGGFKCESRDAGSALLKDIVRDLTSEGFEALIGPMDGDTWHSYRLIWGSDGTPPFLMEPKSGPHDKAAFEAAGFQPVTQYFSARAKIEDALGDRPDAQPGVVISTWDGKDPEEHFSAVHALSSRAFARNLFYRPISREAFLAMYMPFVPLLKRELILLARDADTDALLGFLFGIPNYQEGPAPQSVILKTYASLQPGVGHLLAHQFHKAASDMGFETVVHALIHDDNLSAARSRLHGGDIFRRYALMGRRLDV